jgi:hypothetical protein
MAKIDVITVLQAVEGAGGDHIIKGMVVVVIGGSVGLRREMECRRSAAMSTDSGWPMVNTISPQYLISVTCQRSSAYCHRTGFTAPAVHPPGLPIRADGRLTRGFGVMGP